MRNYLQQKYKGCLPYVGFLLLFCLTSCSGKKPESLVEYCEQAELLSAQADQAYEKRDAKLAKKLRKRTHKFLKDYRAFEEAQGELSEDEAEERDALYQSTRNALYVANLTVEEVFVYKTTHSLKARGYYASRRVALSGVSIGVEFVNTSEEISEFMEGFEEDGLFRRKWNALAAYFSDDDPIVPEETDVELSEPANGNSLEDDSMLELSMDVAKILIENPARVSMALSVGYTLMGKSEFGLYEIYSPEIRGVEDPVELVLVKLIKAFIHSSNECPNLAVQTLESISEEELPPEFAPKLLAGIHLQMACAHLQVAVGNHNGGAGLESLKMAEVELGRALRVWPDSPVAQFLSGEALAASGEYEAAADSLENLMRNTEIEWLAEMLAQRVRQFRDADPDGGDQYIFSDDKFLKDVLLRYLLEEAEKSPAMGRIRELHAASISIADEVLKRLNLSDLDLK